MAQLGMSVSFSEELTETIKLLAHSKNQSVSRFLEYQLRDVLIIKDTIHRFEKIPELPPMVKGRIPHSTEE